MDIKLAYALGVKAAEEESFKFPQIVTDKAKKRNREYIKNFAMSYLPGAALGGAAGLYFRDQLGWLKPDASTAFLLGALKGGTLTGFLGADFMHKYNSAKAEEDMARKVNEMYEGYQSGKVNKTSV